MDYPKETTANATDGPRPRREPVPICVNVARWGRQRELWTLKNRNGVGEYPPIVGKCWERRGFFSHQKSKKGLAQRGIWGTSGVGSRPRHCSSQGDVQDHADIVDLGPSKIFENGNKIKQFVVVCVREPAADGYRVLRVEDVGSRGVVDDDSVPKLTANLREILLDIVIR